MKLPRIFDSKKQKTNKEDNILAIKIDKVYETENSFGTIGCAEHMIFENTEDDSGPLIISYHIPRNLHEYLLKLLDEGNDYADKILSHVIGKEPILNNKDRKSEYDSEEITFKKFTDYTTGIHIFSDDEKESKTTEAGNRIDEYISFSEQQLDGLSETDDYVRDFKLS